MKIQYNTTSTWRRNDSIYSDTHKPAPLSVPLCGSNAMMIQDKQAGLYQMCFTFLMKACRILILSQPPPPLSANSSPVLSAEQKYEFWPQWPQECHTVISNDESFSRTIYSFSVLLYWYHPHGAVGRTRLAYLSIQTGNGTVQKQDISLPSHFWRVCREGSGAMILSSS